MFLFFVSERYFRNSDVRNFNFLLVHAHVAAVSDEATFVISFWQTFSRSMPLSLIQRAKRAFVSVLLKLAFDYGAAVDINRESDDRAVLQCYRRVVKKSTRTRAATRRRFRRCRLQRKFGTRLGKEHALQATLRLWKVSLSLPAPSLNSTGFMRRPCF